MRPDRGKIVRRVADHLCARDRGHRVRVALDGSVSPGLAGLADEIAAAVIAIGHTVRRVGDEPGDVLIAPWAGPEPGGCWDEVIYLDRSGAADPAESGRRAAATIVIGLDDAGEVVLRRIGGPEQATVPLFSYGTLQLARVQEAMFGRRLAGRPDLVPGYRMGSVAISDPDVVAASGSARHPAAVATGDADDEVAGTVLAVTAEELAAAEGYETDDYRREWVRLGSGAGAWMYAAASGRPAGRASGAGGRRAARSR